MHAPKEGEGLHEWLLDKSRSLLIDGYTPEKAVQVLAAATAASGRTTQDVETEIQNAVDGAKEFLDANPQFTSSPSLRRWTDPLSFFGLDDAMSRHDRRKHRLPINQEKREKAISSSSLYAAQNFKFSFSKLYAGVNFDICAGRKAHEAIFRPLKEWVVSRDIFKMSYMVPNYFYETKDRSDLSVGERLFLVVEFDADSLDDQFAFFDFLDRTNRNFPLVLIVYSGGKSLHGWFACYGASEHRVVTFCRQATELGADRATYSPSQYIRVPFGWNYKTRNRQLIVYFNEENLKAQNELVRKELL